MLDFLIKIFEVIGSLPQPARQSDLIKKDCFLSKKFIFDQKFWDSRLLSKMSKAIFVQFLA